MILSLWLAACSYVPPVDPAEPRLLNVIQGSVLFAGLGDPSSVFVTVFHEEDPAPPAGTGSPVTFAAVPGWAFTTGDATLEAADYAVTQLPDGSYFLNALMDVDGDFNPFSSALAGATCGDWGGTHLESLTASTPAAVDVFGGELRDDVTILVGARFDFERPAFSLMGAPSLSLEAALAAPLPLPFRVKSTSVATAFAEDLVLSMGPNCAPEDVVGCDTLGACPCRLDSVSPCGTALWPYLVDADADGLPDPYPAPLQAAAGILDVWPRVYLEYTGALATFDVEGTPRPERWVTEAYPLLGEIALAVAYGGSPASVAPIGTPFPVDQLSVSFVPVFLHYHEGGLAGVDANGPFDVVDLRTGADPSAVPSGAWAVTLVSFTGQTWTVPNEIGLLGLPSLDPLFAPVTQAGAVIVAP